MAFQDLLLAFHASVRPERYRIITHSPTEGKVVAPFVSPFGDSRIRTWQFGLVSDEMQMIGTLLYRRLFPPTIYQALYATQRYARRQGLTVRLKLILDRALNQLPWEYLFDPKANQFLALEQRLAIVRHLELPAGSLNPFAEELALALFVPGVTDRSGAPALETGSAFSEGNADLAIPSHLRARKLSLDDLEHANGLFSNQQILHIEAEAGRDPASGQYALQIGVEEAAPRWVSFESVAKWLRANPTIQLVVLDASVGSGATTREMQGLASALVAQQIVPAVVTLQFPIPALLRAGFWRGFYGALARGNALDLAMTEGRQAIAALNGVWEWGAPVLYSALREDQPRVPADRFQTGVHVQDILRVESFAPASPRTVYSAKTPAAKS
ncbi:MAG: CHAT domain-containing protein [Chloroflexi bacterium]|nr:CHAT domain-containing protein [Chloroflexota bacterium]